MFARRLRRRRLRLRLLLWLLLLWLLWLLLQRLWRLWRVGGVRHLAPLLVRGEACRLLVPLRPCRALHTIRPRTGVGRERAWCSSRGGSAAEAAAHMQEHPLANLDEGGVADRDLRGSGTRDLRREGDLSVAPPQVELHRHARVTLELIEAFAPQLVRVHYGL